MVDFRKTLLLLAIIAMVGSVASAQVTAPFQCSAGLAVPTTVRAEGIAEIMGDFVMQCTGGTPTALGATVPQVNFRIWLNVNVTSKLVSGNYTEAILAIDDPAPLKQKACSDSGAGCPLVGIGYSGGIRYLDPDNSINRQDLGNDVYNIFQGVYKSPNELEWLGVPIDPPGTQEVRIIRITNVRGDANARGVGGLIPLTISMFISTIGSNAIPITDPTQTVAWVIDGMEFSASSGSFLQCESEYAESFCSSSDMYLKYKENFATAFKVQVDDDREDAADKDAWTGQPILGNPIPYNTESGWYNPGIDDNGIGIKSAGLATQGTQLIAMFGQGTPIPSGVNLWVTDISMSLDCGAPSSLQSDNIAVLTSGSTPGWDQVTLTSGVGQAVWEVVEDSPFTDDEIYFGVDVRYTANTTSGIPALGTGTVNGAYYPLSSIHTAYSGAKVPRFVDDSEAKTLVTINSCATNLLFVYVTNQGGFETGMVVTNSSLDPFNTATQEGPCKIYYYGFTTGGLVAAMTPVDIPNVPAGHQAIWTLSSGGTVNTAGGFIAATPGFQGYAIVSCMFQYAHGFAFISDLGANNLAHGYQALILDGLMDEWPRTGSLSEFLDN